MSTERVEINPDQTNESLEQSAENLQKEGFGLTENGTLSNKETSTSISQPDTDIQSSQDRPEWLPEKFQNAEDLAKAYSELEKKMSNPQQEEQPTQESKTEEAPQEGMSLEKYYDEWVGEGTLSDDSYKELENAGLPKELVDGYIEGQKALADQSIGKMYDSVGGEDNYKELMEWASGNLDEAEQNAFNETIENGSAQQMDMALQGLMAKAGIVGSDTNTQILQGETNLSNNDVFSSVAQVTEAMSDPRYEKDPAFRKSVEDKISRSSVL